MTPLTIVLLLVVFFAGTLIAYFLLAQRKGNDTQAVLFKQELDQLRQSLEGNTRTLNDQLLLLNKEVANQLQNSLKTISDSSRHVGDRLDNAARVVGEVQGRLGKLEEASTKIFEVGKDIASLQEILRAPKLRGSLGELFLGDLLAQVLPKDYFELQYGFRSGEKVDAIIRSAQGLIAVDSKFPLENFVRLLETKTEEERKLARRVFLNDVKKHIDSISTKYILPGEGTLDLALMYIPAENVYYEIMLKNEGTEKDLLRYANDKRVFPVSPNSFYAYLQTIAIGLRGMKLAEGVREVLDNVSGLKRDFAKFGDDFAKVGVHLSHARGSFELADKRREKLGEKMETMELPEVRSEGTLRMLKEAES